MWRKSDFLPTEYYLKPGYVMANRSATMIRAILGNCVAVAIFDSILHFGGMHQFVFPRTDVPKDRTPQYGNVGISVLMKMMVDLGSSRDNIVAQIFGGAQSRNWQDGKLGEKNVAFARSALAHLKVPVVSEDVGGFMGRKILYHTGTNETAVFKMDQLAEDAWFLPGTDLRYDFFGN